MFIYGAASGSRGADTGSTDHLTENLMAVLAPTVQNPTGDFASSSLLEIGASAAELADISSSQEDFGIGYAKVNSSVFGLELSGSGVSAASYTASLDSSNDNYITKVFGENPRGDKEAYVYLNLPANQTDITPAAISISCLLYTSPSPRDRQKSRMPSSA